LVQAAETARQQLDSHGVLVHQQLQSQQLITE
jgi:hypothetical protein